jgi:hypothetical protein
VKERSGNEDDESRRTGSIDELIGNLNDTIILVAAWIKKIGKAGPMKSALERMVQKRGQTTEEFGEYSSCGDFRRLAMHHIRGCSDMNISKTDHSQCWKMERRRDNRLIREAIHHVRG